MSFLNQFRFISLASHYSKEIPQNLKGKSKSSQEWLLRQLKDPYVEKARMNNYRCRSAFKLLEINEKVKLLSAGQCVVDCGAAPGSWVQVAVAKTNADYKEVCNKQGFVIGLDRIPIYPIEGAILLGNCDFTFPESREKLKKVLSGRTVDVVLSDMAPNATGVKSMDHEAIVSLAYLFSRFALEVSTIGGSIVVKLWDGNQTTSLQEDLSKFYTSVKILKPLASRSDSSELFLVGTGFKGIIKRKSKDS